MIKFLTVAVVLVVSFSGCIYQRAGLASRAKTELVGMSKIELLSCAGVPVRQERMDNLEFLTYSGGVDIFGTEVDTYTSPSPSIATGKRTYFYCDVTFVLKDGVVQKVNYKGHTGGLLTKGEQCAFVVENCLK